MDNGALTCPPGGFPYVSLRPLPNVEPETNMSTTAQSRSDQMSAATQVWLLCLLICSSFCVSKDILYGSTPRSTSKSPEGTTPLSLEELQTMQPTLAGLASNANVTLLRAVLGVGHQNGTEFVQSLPGSGALALYDITEYLEQHPDRVDDVAQCYWDDQNPDLTCKSLGVHYFEVSGDKNLPTFNLSGIERDPVLSAIKVGDVGAPNSDNVESIQRGECSGT